MQHEGGKILFAFALVTEQIDDRIILSLGRVCRIWTRFVAHAETFFDSLEENLFNFHQKVLSAVKQHFTPKMFIAL